MKTTIGTIRKVKEKYRDKIVMTLQNEGALKHVVRMPNGEVNVVLISRDDINIEDGVATVPSGILFSFENEQTTTFPDVEKFFDILAVQCAKAKLAIDGYDPQVVERALRV